MNVLALIPARGGSKRIPNKNMQEILGKPLIYYSIQFAKRFDGFVEVAVSTDDPAILEYSETLNVTGILRPKKYAGDTSTTGSVLAHSLDFYKKKDVSIDTVVTLQPTNPFRSIKDFGEAFTHFNQGNYDSMLSVAKLPHKFGRVDTGGIYTTSNYSIGQRSQDMEKLYFETGQWYFTRSELAKEGQVLSNRSKAWVTNNWFDGLDIDEPEDLNFAKKLMSVSKGELDFL